MQSGMYVALSGQVALKKRLDTIANNVANMSTAGFRADEVKFETVLSQAGNRPVAFSSSGTDYISRKPGTLTKTDNPLDIAVQGNGWLAVRTPDGVSYTRDGRMRMLENGILQNLDGYPILDAGN